MENLFTGWWFLKFEIPLVHPKRALKTKNNEGYFIEPPGTAVEMQILARMMLVYSCNSST
jgi:hypothetical protein